MNLNFDKLNGLVPVIIQDYEIKQVLMLGFMNQEALQKTLKDRQVWFFSRTKNRLWKKWETSWIFLNVIDIKQDCDNDSLLIQVKPEWSTCHTGSYSCFWEKEIDITFLNKLYQTIQDRLNNPKENSYTSNLIKKWNDKIIQKIWEEAIEVVIAAKNNNKDEIIYESSDLMYHLLIMLAQQWIKLNDIAKELKNRDNKED